MEITVQNRSAIDYFNTQDGLSQLGSSLHSSLIPDGFQRLKELMLDERQMRQVAFCFGMNPTPLRKILENKPPSRYILNKIQKVLTHLSEGSPLIDFIFKTEKGKKLIGIYHLYQKEGTLERVGQSLGVSRERVRQLLDKGSKLGLFEYQTLKLRNFSRLSKEKIVEDYKRTLRLRDVAQLNRISLRELARTLYRYNMSRPDLNAIRFQARREKCIEEYKSFVGKIGFHPSSSEMEKTREGLSLFNRIIRLWGSIKSFRGELNISLPSGSRLSSRA